MSEPEKRWTRSLFLVGAFLLVLDLLFLVALPHVRASSNATVKLWVLDSPSVWDRISCVFERGNGVWLDCAGVGLGGMLCARRAGIRCRRNDAGENAR